MRRLKYPVQYFGGSRLLKHSDWYIKQGLDIVSYDFPIVGETGVNGLKLDFNCGLRLQVPKGRWHVRISDSASGLMIVDRDVSATTLISMEKFFVVWKVEVWLDGKPVFYHQFDPTGRKIHFNMSGAIGDNIALLPYIEQFRRTFECDVTCRAILPCKDIIRTYYPEIRLTDCSTKIELPIPPPPADSYACYFISAVRSKPTASTSDMRITPMELLGKTLLDTPKIRRPSKIIYKPTKPRSIKEPYVCIGVQASSNPKCWLNPGGWDRVVDYLKSLGYRVLCIDREKSCTNYDITVEMPRGAEDFSGNYTLLDRVNQLAYADFFIGLGSALSWLAWAADIPVVLISGISEPWCEFATPYRVHNPLVCHGCYNHRPHETHQILDCLERKDAAERLGKRLYECSKNISSRMVIDAIDRLIVEHRLLDGRRIE